MARLQLFVSLVGMLAMTGCRNKEYGENNDHITEEEMPFGTVVWSCAFAENPCKFEAVGTSSTADILVRREYSPVDHAWYMRLVNGQMSDDPTQDGACATLTDLEVGARYSLVGYKARTGSTATEEAGFSFGVTNADDEDQALADTTVFWHSQQEFPTEVWWKFGSLGFTATKNLKFCIGADSTKELWIAKLEAYYVSNGRNENDE